MMDDNSDMPPKFEYDSAVGGSVNVPECISTYRYAANQANEIKSLLKAINNPTSTKLIFQTLPKHMRRRAMSHHPKRLPRKYRGIHKSQMAKSGPMKVNKRPSRKYRRKSSNMLREYMRRQQKNIWLETHIWHAKRFHMVNKWGYRLPLASCEKTYRACYRAASSNCLLQDISYFGCIEIEGELEILRSNFARITSPNCGLGVCARTYLSGKREGSIELFKIDEYPRSALGKINFLWKTLENDTLTSSRVWFFIHPSCYPEILAEFLKLFDLTGGKIEKIVVDNDGNIVDDHTFMDHEDCVSQKMEINEKILANSEITKTKLSEVKFKTSDDQSNKKARKSQDQLKFVTKSFSYRRAPKYKNSSTGIQLVELKDTINRFRLTGPLSQAVLTNALIPKRSEKGNTWFKNFLESEKNSNINAIQVEYWKNCKNVNSPAQLIPNIILALNIEDLRLNRPEKRSKAIPEPNCTLQSTNVCREFPDNLSYSPIWDFDLRNSLAETIMHNHKYHTLRSKHCLVPGERCEFEDSLQPVPVLLIQRPGSQINAYKRLGFGCGWDLIAPSGYGMMIWLSLIMWGARPGGLRECNSLAKESGQDDYLPDTPSGRKEAADRFTVLKEKYFRLPPNKRCNFNKFAISSPFRAPFKQLVKEWGGDADDNYFVLRDRNLLQQILKSVLHNFEFPKLNKNCIIQIFVKMKTRGNPGDFALICLPEKNDLKKNSKNIIKCCKDPILVEPLRKDEVENERNRLRKDHKKLLKRLRARRVKEKRKKQETSEKRVQIRPAKTLNIVTEQFKKMCQLWIAEPPRSVRNQCSRQVLGYITQSKFSFSEATVTGIGYITMEGLFKLLETQKHNKGEKLLLVRGIQSRNYRYANFKINCQI